MVKLGILIPAFAWALIMTVGVAAWAEEAVDFGTQIRPILSDRCFHCHGPDRETRAAGLRIDLPEAAHEYAIVPGDSDASELFRRITAEDPDERMPPADSNRHLTAEETDLIRRWIDQGAPYEAHWSFLPIEKPPVAQVADDDWSKNEIDRFVLAKLRQAGMAPNPPVEPWRLLRRVSFDLTGLPPTLEQLDDFENDPSEENYQRHVERLLASPAYGEHLAAQWLDAARYSDTYGYQVDRDRFVWPWRDWVIRSLNDNLPYDQFVKQQIAGDLLPDATHETILATTFCRLHPQKVEGGSIPEEFRVEYVADRAQTVATAFLGLTLECARCHDHKYDPLSQREYFEMFAFFNSIDEAGLYSYFTESVPTPTLLLADEDQKQNLARLGEQIEQMEQQRDDLKQKLRDTIAVPTTALQVDLPQPLEHLSFEDGVVVPNRSVVSVAGIGAQLTGDDAIDLKQGNFQRHQPFSVSLWLKTPDVKERAVVFHRSRAWTDAASRGYELLIEEGKLKWSLIHFWPGNAISIHAQEVLPPETWHHVVVTYDGSSRAAGLQIFLNGRPLEVDVVRDKLTRKITGGGQDHISIGQRFRDRGFTGGQVDEFSLYDLELTAAEVVALYARHAREIPELTGPDFQAYRLARHQPELQQVEQELAEARRLRNTAYDATPEIMVMEELPQPRPAFVLARGEYDAPTTPVQPQTPAAFPPLKEDWPRNRLGLAEWIVDRDNPLTARVAVNRYWQLVMGEGLVRTAEDFGSQGSPPTHPELLDYLAADFMEHGWNIKRLLRQIVTSATYRQSSAATPEQLKRDPKNRLLGRGGRFRMSAEMVRDNALATSGLLVRHIGGPPAKPYELAHSFKPVDPDQGEGLYRRSLYTFWQRTSPAPAMLTFDAAKRDVCQVQRERTSSPLQALVLLNGPQYVEAAKMLAVRLVTETPSDEDAGHLTRLFRTLTSRRPSQEELEVLQQLFTQQQAHFEAHPEKAEQLLTTGQAEVPQRDDQARLAALTVVANTLMNFDGCVTRR